MLQAFGAAPLDPGCLSLPLHHGDAVAELRQPGDCPRPAHQDPGIGGKGKGRSLLNQLGTFSVVLIEINETH